MPSCPDCGRNRTEYYGYLDGEEAYRCGCCDWRWVESNPYMLTPEEIASQESENLSKQASYYHP